MITRFKDRTDAGHQLAPLLRGLRDENVVVVALPRGGVPVGYEVARALKAPLDVLDVRELGVPWQEDVVMGVSGSRPTLALRDRTVVLVDDAIASGAIVRAAISVIRAQTPVRLVLAAPVVQQSVSAELRPDVDDLACVYRPTDLSSIGTWYDHFPDISEEEVRAILSRAAAELSATHPVQRPEPSYEPHVS